MISLGGNAVKDGTKSCSYKDEEKNIERTAREISKLVKKGWHLIITHGNGPQVGELMLRQEIAKEKVGIHPLYILDAQTQGEIGFLIQQSLDNVLKQKGIKRSVITLITRALVNKNDPAFKKPTKPIGPFFTKSEARKLALKYGWSVTEDSGRGWRRIVPSPEPILIPEMEAIKNLFEKNIVVVAGGGGGIPVVKSRKGYCGIEAVIDKDKISCLLALELNVDLLIFLTGVEKVAVNYGKYDQRDLDFVSLAEIKKYYSAGHFPGRFDGPENRIGD